MKRECETCIKRKTPYCPTSIDCMATDDMPYYQNRIMLLEENQELKKQLEEYKNKLIISTKMEIKEIDKNTFVGIDYFQNKCIVYNNQQKEFIEYLENEINKWHYNYDNYTYEYELEEPTAEELLQTVLSKYKEILGGKE